MASTRKSRNQTMHQAEPDNHAATNDNITTRNAAPTKRNAGTKAKVATKTKSTKKKSTSKGKSGEDPSQSIQSRKDYDNGAAQIAFRVDGMISINIFTPILILIFACSRYGRS